MKLTQFLSLAVSLVERGYSSPVADKGDVRRAVYRTILDRSRETHGRPTVGSQYGEPYQRLLRAAAEKHAHRVEMDRSSIAVGHPFAATDARIVPRWQTK